MAAGDWRLATGDWLLDTAYSQSAVVGLDGRPRPYILDIDILTFDGYYG
jgi:hypothetical protein